MSIKFNILSFFATVFFSVPRTYFLFDVSVIFNRIRRPWLKNEFGKKLDLIWKFPGIFFYSYHFCVKCITGKKLSVEMKHSSQHPSNKRNKKSAQNYAKYFHNFVSCRLNVFCPKWAILVRFWRELVGCWTPMSYRLSRQPLIRSRLLTFMFPARRL